MSKVKAKKHLGQHFLNDENIAKKIVDALEVQNQNSILEIGPGMGVLTKYIIEKPNPFFVVEIDNESVVYLKENYPTLSPNIIEKDFLKLDFGPCNFTKKFSLIGNFPYNISSQILFKTLEHRSQIIEIVGMFQKEVAERICAIHGNKIYGRLSVLLQVFYHTEYLFTVNENVFTPPPKVKSGVIRLSRKKEKLDCDEQLFFRIVKMSFNQRRKNIWNSLKPLTLPQELREYYFFSKRPEQLSVEEFVELTKLIQNGIEAI